MFLGIQLLGVLFALFMLYLTFLYSKRKDFTTKEGIFWFSLWAVFVFITMFPRTMMFFVKNILGMSRTLDFFIIIGFMFFLLFTFYTYTIIRKTQNKVNSLVRKIAIEKRIK